MAIRSRHRPRHLYFFGRRFVIHGLPRPIWHDLYHLFMTVRWPVLFMAFGLFFCAINLLFACVYAVRPGDIANLDPPGYWGLFFFSAETFATVGYGDMHPRTPFSHVIATLENFVGLTSLAVITGMMFARFSRPTARILFARHGVIRPFDGASTLILRVANARANIIMEASASLRLIREDITVEGMRIRRIYDLPLRRSQQPAFLFGWNLLHVIDAASPLAGANRESLEAAKAFLILTIIGTDETTGQVLMARERYAASTLRWNHSFVDILHTDEHGVDHFDYTKFDELEPLEAPMNAIATEMAPEQLPSKGGALQ
jgi:inward rectifier potassium channel